MLPIINNLEVAKVNGFPSKNIFTASARKVKENNPFMSSIYLLSVSVKQNL